MRAAYLQAKAAADKAALRAAALGGGRGRNARGKKLIKATQGAARTDAVEAIANPAPIRTTAASPIKNARRLSDKDKHKDG